MKKYSLGISVLIGLIGLAMGSVHAGTILFESAWEDGQVPGDVNQVLYSKDVVGYSNSLTPPPECGRRTGEMARSGKYSLVIAGYSRGDDAYCYYQVFQVQTPVQQGMKIGYWIYHAEGVPNVAVDGHFTDGDTLRDFGGGVLKDQYGMPIHPAARQEPLNQWHHVEVDLSPAAGKVLQVILFGFDNGGKGFQGPYRTYVDDFRIFVGDAQSDCLASVPGNHWKGEYFNNMDLSGTPFMVRDDGAGFLNFDWGEESPSPACGIREDQFSVRWIRKVNFEPGYYQFTVVSNDGVRLWVGDQILLDKWFEQAPTTYTAGPVLLSGERQVGMEYYENTVGAVAQLYWELVEKPPIHCEAQVSEDRWRGEYFSNRFLNGNPSMVRDDGGGFLDINWGRGSPGSSCGIGADQFSVRWTRKVNFPAGHYKFAITADDGVKVWVDDQIILEKWFDQPAMTYSRGPIYLAGPHILRMEYYENGGEAVAQLSWQQDILPASGILRVPVFQLAYFPPDPDKPNYLDEKETGWANMEIAQMRAATQEMVDAALSLINDSSRYHGYKDPGAPRYLEYFVSGKMEALGKMPRGISLETNPQTGQPYYRPHYGQIMRDINICYFVDQQGIKEVWIYGYHSDVIVPDESKMSSKHGDISNANPKDEFIPEEYRLPKCNNSYVMYNFTYQPGGGLAFGNTVHNRLHQLENVIFFAENKGYPPNSYNVVGSLFWDDFSVYGDAASRPGYRASCGNTLSPPNMINEGYNYVSDQFLENNCETWHPDDRQTTYGKANCEQWGCTDVGFYRWFMQNIPGYDNGSVYQGKKMRNWWGVMYDFNRFIDGGRSLWEETVEIEETVTPIQSVPSEAISPYGVPTSSLPGPGREKGL